MLDIHRLTRTYITFSNWMSEREMRPCSYCTFGKICGKDSRELACKLRVGSIKSGRIYWLHNGERVIHWHDIKSQPRLYDRRRCASCESRKCYIIMTTYLRNRSNMTRAISGLTAICTTFSEIRAKLIASPLGKFRLSDCSTYVLLLNNIKYSCYQSRVSHVHVWHIVVGWVYTKVVVGMTIKLNYRHPSPAAPNSLPVVVFSIFICDANFRFVVAQTKQDQQ